ncbi:MAG: hypothetical protein CSB16_02780 [Clostridiales bacterium]|nr:MAG: hypothetical protein CSB16_02780 [Clostridiales bacterium]
MKRKKKIISNISLFLILLIIWIALNESLTWRVVFLGAFFSLVSIILTRLLFSDNDNITSYEIPLWFLIYYLFAMLFFIIKASFDVILNLIKGKVKPRVVTIKSKLHNPWYISIIANSITLTPGTVTLDKTGNVMKVLWYYSDTDDEDEQYEKIAAQFEKLFFLVDKKG